MDKKAALCAYLIILSICSGLLYTPLSQAQEKTLEDQANEISGMLLCPVCQGQSVSESNSNLANDMRQVIKNKLEEGQSKEEIIAYFVQTYGETILAAPPAKGINWVLWILPGIAIAVGVVAIGVFLLQAGESEEDKETVTTKPDADSDDPYLNKIDEELKENS